MANQIANTSASARRPQSKTAKAHLSIEAYHKLNRSRDMSFHFGLDLQKQEFSGMHQLYAPLILSYISEDIGFVLEELKDKGLCADFIRQPEQ